MTKKKIKPRADAIGDPLLPDYSGYIQEVSRRGRSDLPTWVYRKKYDMAVLVDYLGSLPSIARRRQLVQILRLEYGQDAIGIEDLKQQLLGSTLADLIKVDRDLNDEINALDCFGYELSSEIKKYDLYVEEEEVDTKRRERGNYNPSDRGLTQQLGMLLLDELFPNLKNASNTAKAKFLAFLTGWSEDKLRIKWTDYRSGNPTTLKEDREAVEYWRQKLKIEK